MIQVPNAMTVVITKIVSILKLIFKPNNVVAGSVVAAAAVVALAVVDVVAPPVVDVVVVFGRG